MANIPEDGLGKVHHGDCIAGMNALPAGSIDLVFADPPFNIGYEYDVYHDSKGSREYLDWSRKWIGAVHRVLKPDGTFWLAIGDEFAAELKIASQEIGFHARSWVIWYYTFGVNCKSKFSRSHAHLFYFVKDEDNFTFRFEQLENRIPSARFLVYGDRRSNPEGRLPDDTWILRPQDLADCFTPSEDTWYLPRVAGTFKERRGFHGCQMPEQLLGRIIRACSAEGEVVLDPFSGSATTLAVAKKLGRRFLGFDLSDDYVKRGTDRIAGVHRGEPLEGAPEPLITAPKSAGPRGGKDATKKSPLEEILEASENSQRRKLDLEFGQGVLEAFRRTYVGYSVDRVVTDPELNAAFVSECEKLGLPGEARWWNQALFRMRKAGKLADYPNERRTELSWHSCDGFLFGSEIAWRKMLDRKHRSLDEILCDPRSAEEFDTIARRYAPGSSSLQYRWGALKLRKECKRVWSHSQLIGDAHFAFSEPLGVGSVDVQSAPHRPGVYIATDEGSGEPLYAGETFDLCARFECQFGPAVMERWDDSKGALSLRYFEASKAASVLVLLAYQALFVQKHRPRLNLVHGKDRNGREVAPVTRPERLGAGSLKRN
jgi:DNA modification methylase